MTVAQYSEIILLKCQWTVHFKIAHFLMWTSSQFQKKREKYTRKRKNNQKHSLSEQSGSNRLSSADGRELIFFAPGIFSDTLYHT